MKSFYHFLEGSWSQDGPTVVWGGLHQTTEVQDEKSEDHIETMQRLNVTMDFTTTKVLL